MRRLAILLAVLVCASAAGAQNGVIHGNGDPRTLSPTPNCGTSRFFIDDTTAKLYIAASGSPCVWTDASPAIAAVTVGPYVSFFDDFMTAVNMTTAAIGAASGQACANTNAGPYADNNHEGILLLVSGTGGTGTGIACYMGSSSTIYGLSTAPAWVMETEVLIPALPGTTAGSYQAGLSNTITDPWTNAVGFYLSSANATVNDWYCSYGATPTLVDSGIVAVANTYTRLSVVSDGTTARFYINGVVACSTPASNISPSIPFSPVYTTVAKSGTSVKMAVDYFQFQRQVAR